MLAGMSEGLRNFAQKYNVAINDPNLVRLYQLEQDAIRDEKSRMAYAVQHAVQHTRQETNRENAVKMKIKGYPNADIAEITGLSIKEIMAL